MLKTLKRLVAVTICSLLMMIIIGIQTTSAYATTSTTSLSYQYPLGAHGQNNGILWLNITYHRTVASWGTDNSYCQISYATVTYQNGQTINVPPNITSNFTSINNPIVNLTVNASNCGSNSISPTPINNFPQPIVGMASTPNGQGYWLVGSNGSVYNYGDANNYGSMMGKPLNQPIVGISADPITGGYWLVAADGGVFSFNAPFYGSMGGQPLNTLAVGISGNSNSGYWLILADGTVFPFGKTPYYG